MDLFEYFNNILAFFQNPIWKYLFYGLIFVLIIVWLAFVYWTYRDAKLRVGSQASAIFWAAVVLILNFLGLILYLILIPPDYLDDVAERDLEIERMETLLNNKESSC